MSNNCTKSVTTEPGTFTILVFSGCTGVDTVPPANYGLRSYDVATNIVDNIDGLITSDISLSFNVLNIPIRSTYNIVTNTVNVESGPSSVSIISSIETPNTFLIRVFSLNNTNPLTYQVTYTATRIFITLQIPSSSLDGSFQVPGPDVVPNITVTTQATPDKQQICVLDFTVTAYDANESVVTTEFLQYCVPFASVICTAGCTLRQKLDSLQLGEDFLQYMVLRYILSGILNVGEFNEFNVNLLRQCYNKEFLRALVGTQYRVFLPTLKANPSFATYFKC